ncbi:hypothetical protein HPB51_008161 [Rhipicephalus microplus]|uniref:Uncharacterized protein n=1 Tax=Rhipicephalus microplus TaxID=6941 RepID=A0A9J6D4M0_RHIMP|nr:hypothetical protein HPB51_008161 [Rhipicephalus microplus]
MLLLRIPVEHFKIVFRPGGRFTSALQLRASYSNPLQLVTIDYAVARIADRVRINPYNNSLTASTQSESRTRLYLRTSELRLATISYPPTSLMEAPDNALHGIIYNTIDSQTQDNKSLTYELEQSLCHRRRTQAGALKIYPTYLRRYYHTLLVDSTQLWRLPLPPIPLESRGLHELLHFWPSFRCLHQAQVRPLLLLRLHPRESGDPDLRPMLHPVQRRPRQGLTPVQTPIQQDWPVTLVPL